MMFQVSRRRRLSGNKYFIMIHLHDGLLVGKGNLRSCYRHPSSPEYCIKVFHTWNKKAQVRCQRELKYLNRYKVVACARDPYMRLPSAVNEYYRQKSKHHEALVREGKLTMELRKKYYRKLRSKHSELDPRFIHSLPIHRFTHYGLKAKVDYLLRCESLDEDIQELSKTLKWPTGLQNAVDAKIENFKRRKKTFKLTEEEIEIAENIYEVDFNTFGYVKDSKVKKDRTGRKKDAGSVKHIHDLDEITWHWGPTARRNLQKLKALRRT